MLEECLQHQQQLLDQLVETLKEEQGVLTIRDVDAINEMAQRKTLLLEQLVDNDQQIAAHPQRELLTSSPKLSKQRQSLQEQLVLCQEINTINGRIIKASSDEIEQLAHQMNKLLAKNSMTYDKSGRSHTASRHGKSFKV